MNITSSLINLEVSDGSMAAFVSRPNDDESHPAIIVIQEIFGVNANIRKITETFAAQGYISVAPDLFHRSGSLLDIPYSEMDTARGLAGSTSPDSLISDLETVVRHLQADPFSCCCCCSSRRPCQSLPPSQRARSPLKSRARPAGSSAISSPCE